MSVRKPLAMSSNVVFTYDGSFEGFLCCVYESVYSRRLPAEILAENASPITLMEVWAIPTDLEKAGRVHRSIPEKISPRALELVHTVFFSCLEEKEVKLLAFLLRAYREGPALLRQLGDGQMAPLLGAERHLHGEVHLLKGFVRFADVGGALVSTITPKNFVLPFLANHFTRRFDREEFLIFDQTHRAGLLYQKGRAQLLQVDQLEIPPFSEEESRYQALWKQFYNTITIAGRENPRCRMTHMPKRYWENMLEVRELLSSTHNDTVSGKFSC